MRLTSTDARMSLAVIGMILALDASSAAEVAGGVVAARARGAAVFSKYCVLCHGVEGRGDGRAAAMQKAPPADLTRSARSAEYRARIVQLGGAAMNRSSSMPAWADVLTPAEMKDLLVYLNALNRPEPARNAAATSAASR